jgi:hypothetical protein
MRQVAHLSFADAAAWAAAHATHFADVAGVHVVERGTEFDGETPRAGYRVDVLLDGVDLPQALWANIVNDETRHQFLGYSTCVAPEIAPDDGDVILVERADGQPASAADIARAEIAHVRRKLAAEQREDRRAVHVATAAVVEQRVVTEKPPAPESAAKELERLREVRADKLSQIKE